MTFKKGGGGGGDGVKGCFQVKRLAPNLLGSQADWRLSGFRTFQNSRKITTFAFFPEGDWDLSEKSNVWRLELKLGADMRHSRKFGGRPVEVTFSE